MPNGSNGRMNAQYRSQANAAAAATGELDMAAIPNLERHCGSWIVVSRATGKPVLETYERKTAEAINQTAYEVLTAAQWLGRFNAELKASRDHAATASCGE